MTISLSFFPTYTHEGHLLRQAFVHLAESLGFQVKIPNRPTPLDVANACWNDDLVVFDGSIEGTQHNYAIAFEPSRSMEHVLIVSRTPLPLNYLGFYTDGSPIYPSTLSNQEILKWLRSQLLTLMPKLPRAASEKGALRQLTTLSHSIKLEEQRRRQIGQVFISYRSRYQQEVENIRHHLLKLDSTGIQGKTTFFYPPGALAFEDEVLTEQRRWQILSMIRWSIQACEEFWIYDSSDTKRGKKDYLNSWWTRGELAILAYHYPNGRGGPRLRLYDPRVGRPEDISYVEIPAQTKEEGNRMARWFANSDPTEMGPESTLQWRALHNTPLIGSLPFARDHVWSDEFWDYPIIQCRSEYCQQLYAATSRGRLGYSMNDLLWTKGPYFLRLRPAEFETVVSGRRIVQCAVKECGAKYALERAQDRYLALALPVDSGQRLQSLPTYRANMISHGESNR